MPSVWSNETTRASIADEHRKAAPATWRTELYWIKLVDPPPGARRGDVWAQCRRCGVLSLVTLPADLGDALARMREICAAHAGCKQTLSGARWELLVTLRRRAALKAEAL